jgi:pimeloyl-ACP methyl ester carboxylesterase
MGVLKNGAVAIHYEVVGRGPDLVLHTGAGGDLRIWKYAGYLDGLDGFRVILIDQRGRGESDRPDRVEDHSMERYVEDIAKVLDEVGADSAGFWGYSNGTVVGLAFGATHPRRLKALAGLGALPFMDYTDLPAIPDPEAFIAERIATGGVRAEVDRFMQAEQDRFPDEIDRNVRETDPRMGALRALSWRRWRGPKSLLPLVTAPVLEVAGEKELEGGGTELAVATLPHARLEVVPSQGHLGVFYRSDLTLPRVLPFLREHVN